MGSGVSECAGSVPSLWRFFAAYITAVDLIIVLPAHIVYYNTILEPLLSADPTGIRVMLPRQSALVQFELCDPPDPNQSTSAARQSR